MIALADHWDRVWAGRDPATTSWYQERAQPSLDLVRSVAGPTDPVVDVGGGRSPLAAALVQAGYAHVAVVDVAEPVVTALRRLHGDRVAVIHGDVRTLQLPGPVAVWHDRAVLHFLTDPADQQAYAARAAALVRPGGHVVIGAFAPDGPATCSGLPVQRHDATSLADLLGAAFELRHEQRHDHLTPQGHLQPFTVALLRRR